MPQEGYKYFVETVRSHADLQNVHFFFHLDNISVDISLIYRKHLILSLVKNGILYTNIPSSFAYRNETIPKSISTSKIQNKIIKFISLNIKEGNGQQKFSKNNEIRNIDYSGFDNTGKRVMGIVTMAANNVHITLDPTYCWNVPDKWSLEEATTVPYAYLAVSRQCNFNKYIYWLSVRFIKIILLGIP